MKIELICERCGGKRFRLRTTGFNKGQHFKRYECKKCYKNDFVNIEIRYDR